MDVLVTSTAEFMQQSEALAHSHVRFYFHLHHGAIVLALALHVNSKVSKVLRQQWVSHHVVLRVREDFCTLQCRKVNEVRPGPVYPSIAITTQPLLQLTRHPPPSAKISHDPLTHVQVHF
ncbi:hypothetical protein EGR_11194 [Echinococcus granulosus]|uniref:Uncharacterized protein n=1 Tax=Echinococcus granulosus TaxID=6210 RepID=W6UKD9_ECHGR|nr:hypothetical protein EGR_11194 [Echinococcus granulosus]EUB53949.1 hypothetical protein EGR_11194 [Echinococcus granulosus]